MDDLITKKQAVSRISDLLVLELKMTRPPTWNEVYNAIKEIPPVDAVEVVRCKDCEHDKYCCRIIRSSGRLESDFCSYGERKEDG